MKTFDAMVVGAGVFGAWTALHLRRTGRSVRCWTLMARAITGPVPAESRASSALNYGADEIYTRWAMRSLEMWTSCSSRSGGPNFSKRPACCLRPVRATRALPPPKRRLRNAAWRFSD